VISIAIAWGQPRPYGNKFMERKKSMSEKYPECPLYNPLNCKEYYNPKICAFVKKDRICLKKKKPKPKEKKQEKKI